jgi:hypothetical protein
MTDEPLSRPFCWALFSWSRETTPPRTSNSATLGSIDHLKKDFERNSAREIMVNKCRPVNQTSPEESNLSRSELPAKYAKLPGF